LNSDQPAEVLKQLETSLYEDFSRELGPVLKTMVGFIICQHAKNTQSIVPQEQK